MPVARERTTRACFAAPTPGTAAGACPTTSLGLAGGHAAAVLLPTAPTRARAAGVARPPLTRIARVAALAIGQACRGTRRLPGPSAEEAPALQVLRPLAPRTPLVVRARTAAPALAMDGIPSRRGGVLGLHVPLLHQLLGLLAGVPAGLPIGLAKRATAAAAGLAAQLHCCFCWWRRESTPPKTNPSLRIQVSQQRCDRETLTQQHQHPRPGKVSD